MSFLYVSIFDSILIYMVATLIIYVSIELYYKRYTCGWIQELFKFLVEEEWVSRKQLCAKYVLRHLNLFKEMLNTNKDSLSKRLNMAKRRIQGIIFCSFDCTTPMDETWMKHMLIGIW